MSKRFNIKPLKMEMERNGFIKGFNLKRDLTYSECAHILRNLLGIDINKREDCYDNEEWQEYRDEIISDVNAWLVGDLDDEAIAVKAYDCADEQLGMKNLIPIICYLQKKEII